MCIYEFNLNNDIAQINYKTFHETPDDIYPSITLCVKMPFRLTHWFNERYEDFIDGRGHIKPAEVANFMNIDYDEVININRERIVG